MIEKKKQCGNPGYEPVDMKSKSKNIYPKMTFHEDFWELNRPRLDAALSLCDSDSKDSAY